MLTPYNAANMRTFFSDGLHNPTHQGNLLGPNTGCEYMFRQTAATQTFDLATPNSFSARLEATAAQNSGAVALNPAELA